MTRRARPLAWIAALLPLALGGGAGRGGGAPAEDQRPHDLTHCYNCAVAAVNGGQMDGFNQSEPDDTWAFTQFRPEQLPNYWHWTERNVLFDRFFATSMGPSCPNHLYSIAATSGGSLDNPVQTFAALREQQEKGLAKSWGCDSAEPGAGGEISA